MYYDETDIHNDLIEFEKWLKKQQFKSISNAAYTLMFVKWKINQNNQILENVDLMTKLKYYANLTVSVGSFSLMTLIAIILLLFALNNNNVNAVNVTQQYQHLKKVAIEKNIAEWKFDENGKAVFEIKN